MSPSDLRQRIQEHDPKDMLGAIRAFPEHFREGWVRAADLQPRHRAQDLDHVIVIGMGGSAIGGDLLRTFAREGAGTPVSVIRDYMLPGWVGERTLVIASSYSGNTEETLSAFEDALDRGASAYVITAGGDLHTEAQQRDLPHVVLPGGLQPRAALGYSLGALLRVAEKLGLVDITDGIFEAANAATEERAEAFSDIDGGNPALDLARTLHDRLTVFYTGPGLLEAVGMRWRTQIHENAKQLAYGNVFAELNHNEIMGWEAAPDAIRDRIAVVVLRDPSDHPQVQRRMEVTRGLLEGRVGSWTEITAEGESPLARMLTTIQLGDFASFYLAMLNGVDPTPVGTIQSLKKTLAGD